MFTARLSLKRLRPSRQWMSLRHTDWKEENPGRPGYPLPSDIPYFAVFGYMLCGISMWGVNTAELLPAHIAQKDITCAVDGFDKTRVFWVFFEFGAQARNPHVHGPIKAFACRPAQRFLHLCAADQAFGAVQKQP